MTKNLADVVQEYVGTPYVHLGRKPGKALDCIGVVICGLREMGLEPEDWPNYGELPRESDLVSRLDDSPLVERVTGEPMRGDILALRWKVKVRHVAVLVDRKAVIRADYRRGVVRTYAAWSLVAGVFRVIQ